MWSCPKIQVRRFRSRGRGECRQRRARYRGPANPWGWISTSYVAPASPKRMTEPLPNCFFDLAQCSRESLLAILFHVGVLKLCVRLLFHIQRLTLVSYASKSQSFSMFLRRYPVVTGTRLLYMREASISCVAIVARVTCEPPPQRSSSPASAARTVLRRTISRSPLKCLSSAVT